MPTPPLVTFILGGWDLGICADLILQGVVFAQIAHYVALYSEDLLALRAFVAILLILTTLKSVQGIVMLWLQNVTHFTDIGAAVGLFATAWPTKANISFVALIAFYVQLFFCQRLWVISRNIYVVGAILALFVFALVAAIVSTVYTFANVAEPPNARWIGIHLGTVFAGDAALCGSTVYFLLAQSKQVSPQTGGLLNAIVKLTFQSAAPAALCTLLNLIGSQGSGRIAEMTNGGTSAWTMLALMSNFALPKLYALSAMWTLNSRKEIRSANLELGTLSLSRNRNVVPIQVRTQVQTMQHADDMFSPKSDMSENDER
ncbi:hypothetical protein C8R44DRAFT_873471 [Mycena epipterygia]|nr:hypothetical protein C8R44DRAFT_873471 [Mycena epipterygia]